MSLEKYLKVNYTSSSAKSYQREINHYLVANNQAETANYKDLISYLNEQRKVQKPSSMHRILQSLKKYYNYLVYAEIREDNPAQNLQIKDYKSRLPITKNRLLNQEEILTIWEHFLTKKYRYKALKHRNICLVSLLLFQGLTAGEIKRLTIEDIDLEKTQIHVPKTKTNNSRILSLQPCQILPFYTYIFQKRNTLLKNKNPTNTLFISKLGKAENGENLHYLLETIRYLYPNKKINPKTVRMSIISHQFEQGKDIQEVQYFAGHRYPSSTERYKTSHLENLQQGVLKHHPLG
jgi:site-specific recombinase XerD